MKKQILTVCTASLLALTAAQGIFASAEDSAKVYVSIADKGALTVVREEVEVTDLDGDGALTVADALTAAHDKCFEGGSAVGFRIADSDWGKSITKLWGVENGGSYSYTVNNVFSMGPTDPVKAGDHVYAGVMQNTSGDFDDYTFFDPEEAEFAAGEAFTLTLKEAGWDESFNQVNKPLSGAAVTVNGKDTGKVTDADGKVTLTVSEAGKAQISASVSDHVIFPPIAVVNITESTVTEPTDTTAAADSTTSAVESETTASAGSTSAANGSGTSADGSVPAPKTGESAPAAVAVAAVLTLGAAFAARRRHAE
ncbi:MAG: hypothetical protein J6Z45_02450 [Oscillospiraceae bacterium]|nr:hypothetical protein [Oscillospiraceae bacterium]